MQENDCLYLVVFTGYPCSGKSKMSHTLSLHKGWERIGGDDIQMELFGSLHVVGGKDQRLLLEETLATKRDANLVHCRNVLIDRCSPLNKSRRRSLTPTHSVYEVLGRNGLKLKRFLIHVVVGVDMAVRRAEIRGEETDAVIKAIKKIHEDVWEDPRTYDDVTVTLLEYDNNTEADFTAAIKDMKRRFNIQDDWNDTKGTRFEGDQLPMPR